MILRTKPDDTVYETDIVVRKPKDVLRYMHDPRYDRIEIAINRKDEEGQRQAILAALDDVWEYGGRTVYIDEMMYLTDLKLEHKIKRLMTQSRSLGTSVIMGMQRPVEIPRTVISQCTHLCTFVMDGRDVLTVKQALGTSAVQGVDVLPRHHFRWYSVVERKAWTGTVQELW